MVPERLLTILGTVEVFGRSLIELPCPPARLAIERLSLVSVSPVDSTIRLRFQKPTIFRVHIVLSHGKV